MAKIPITPNQTFLHGTDRYEPDETYEVTEAEAFYFAANGWIDVPAGVDDIREVSLDIHDADHESES